MAEDESSSRTLAEKLDHLFRTIHSRGRGEYTYREVAEAINDKGGTTISPSYIWQLRAGAKDNPTKRHMEALAEFFGVSPAYFFDDAEAEKIDAQLALVAAMRDAGVRHAALRAAGLSVQSLDVIQGMIERTRELEGLPTPEGPAESSAPQPGEDDTSGS